MSKTKKINPTIEDDIQLAIFKLLPKDGTIALEILAQLTANMLLQVHPEMSTGQFLVRLQWHYDAYVEVEKAL